MTLGWYCYMTLLSFDELTFLWPYILLTSGNLSSMSRLGQSFDLRDWIWMLQVFRQQRQRPSNGRGLEEKKNMSWNLWALASGSVSPDTAGIQAFSFSLPLGAGCGCTFPDAFQATSERSFSGTKLLLSFSFTKRVSGQQTLSVHSFLYAVRTCCLSGTPLDKPCFCA